MCSGGIEGGSEGVAVRDVYTVYNEYELASIAKAV